MLLSAIVMIKNEEEYVGYSIMSVYDYVDEILVVDGGSTDGTVSIIENIIKKYDKDKKIIFWEDFRPKNQLIYVRTDMVKKCKGDWILRLEGDEVYSDYNARKIRRLAINGLKNPAIKSIGWPYQFFVENLQTIVPIGEPHTLSTIMIKNDKGMHADHHYRDGLTETFYDEGWFDINNKEVSIWHPGDNRSIITRNIEVAHYAGFKSGSRHNAYVEICKKKIFTGQHPQVFKRYDFKPLMKNSKSIELIKTVEQLVVLKKDRNSLLVRANNSIKDLKINFRNYLVYQYKGIKN